MTRKTLYLVTRTDNDSGMVLRASSPDAAARLSQRWASMRGATTVKVQPYCTPGEAVMVTIGAPAVTKF
jgi:hypothetical protein